MKLTKLSLYAPRIDLNFQRSSNAMVDQSVDVHIKILVSDSLEDVYLLHNFGYSINLELQQGIKYEPN